MEFRLTTTATHIRSVAEKFWIAFRPRETDLFVVVLFHFQKIYFSLIGQDLAPVFQPREFTPQLKVGCQRVNKPVLSPRSQ
jgi:hypothetical protein